MRLNDRLESGGSLAGARVTVMGLGLHGGGVAATRYLAQEGAEVTVTDLRSREQRSSSLQAIADLPVRLVMGRHEERDFTDADFVVKNPAVPRHSAFLKKARRVETDMSLFLREFSGPLLAVTGTKGKSTTSGALHYGLTKAGLPGRLGGNITISPLTFLRDLEREETVVLELSSFQLGDLSLVEGGLELLSPRIAVVTSFFRDHQDYYGSMESYFADKALLVAAVPEDGAVVLGVQGEYAKRFAEAAQAPVFWAQADGGGAGVRLTKDGVRIEAERPIELSLPASTPESPSLRLNYAMTLLALSLYGVETFRLEGCLEGFPGVEHRLEYCGEIEGRRIYNDSAATVPEATLQAVRAFRSPVRLIAGGTDKKLDYRAISAAVAEAAGTYFLAGSGTVMMLRALGGDAADGGAGGGPGRPKGLGNSGRRAGAPITRGPFETLEDCLEAALADARPGEVVVFSPGCASFEKFDNEFHRGRVFKSLVDAKRRDL